MSARELRSLNRELDQVMPLRRIKVAIVGQPNVGKSTLYNRFVPRRDRAITSKIPGTTRDRRITEGTIAGLQFTVIDTGGLEDGAKESVEAQMRLQVKQALEEADVVLYMLDARLGATAQDEEYARWVRRHAREGATVVPIANKAEAIITGVDAESASASAASPAASPAHHPPPGVTFPVSSPAGGWSEAWGALVGDVSRLGFGSPIAMSAEHGDGMGPPAARHGAAPDPPATGMAELHAELLAAAQLPEAERDAVLADARARADADGTLTWLRAVEQAAEAYREREALAAAADLPGEDKEPLYLAVVGQPNVGKSTLINSLTRSSRLVTGPTPGVTRDAIAVEWSHEGRPVRLIDTAGIRRWAKRDHYTSLEGLMVDDSMAAIRSAAVVVLLVEATGSLTRFELQLANIVREEGRALIVALNKCDLLSRQELGTVKRSVLAQLQSSMPEFGDVACLNISALTATNISRILPQAEAAFTGWRKRVPTAHLNNWLRAVTTMHPPPASKQGKRVRVKYCTQASAKPPSFVFFMNREGMPDAYIRFLQNRLRTEFDLDGVPIRTHTRTTHNPFAPKKDTAKPAGFRPAHLLDRRTSVAHTKTTRRKGRR